MKKDRPEGQPPASPAGGNGEKTPETQSDLPDTWFLGPDGKKYWKDGHAAVKEL